MKKDNEKKIEKIKFFSLFSFFFLFFMIVNTNIYADISYVGENTGCGYIASDASGNSKTVTPISKDGVQVVGSRIFYKEYEGSGGGFFSSPPQGFETLFKAYDCPDFQGAEDVSLVSINFETGEYICSYDLGDGKPPVRKVYVASYQTKDEYDEVIKKNCSSVPYDLNIKGQFELSPDLIKDITPIFSEGNDYKNYLKTSEIYYATGTFINFITAIQKSRPSLNVNVNNFHIDSHSYYDRTVAGALAGLITLDTSYIGGSGAGGNGGQTAINSYGEIVPNDNIKNIDFNALKSNTSNVSPDDALTSVIKTVVTNISFMSMMVANYGNNLSQTIYSPYDIFDKQIMGWYVAFMANLKNVYYTILYKLFILGGLFLTGGVLYKKFMSRYGTEQFNLNTVSRTSSIIMAFVFFTAPTISDFSAANGSNPNAPNIRNDYIYQEINNGNNATVKEYFRYSTFAQEAVRYIANYATYFGNYTNDTLLYSFLNFMKYKQGFLNLGELRTELGSEYQNFQATINSIVPRYEFYKYVCKSIFSDFYEEHKTFIVSQEELDNLWLGDQDRGILEKVGLSNVKKIDPQICYAIEKEIPSKIIIAAGQSAQVIDSIMKGYQIFKEAGYSIPVGSAQYSFMNKIKEKILKWTNGNSSAKAFNDYLALMAGSNNYIGWIFSSAIPVSYVYLKDSDVFFYDSVFKEHNRAKSWIKSASIRENEESISPDKTIKKEKGSGISDEAIKGALQERVENYTAYGVNSLSFVDSMVSGTAWFFVPGFGKTYTAIYDTLRDIVYSSKENDVDSDSGLLKTLIGLLSTVLKGAKFLSMLGDFLITGGIAIIAFLIAHKLYSIMIMMAVMIIITLMIVFRIIMFFLELLMYYVLAPILPIMAFQAGNNMKDFLSHFVKHLVVLLFTPTIIVVSAYLYIFAHNLVINIFNSTVNLITGTIAFARSKLTYGSVALNSPATDVSNFFSGVASNTKLALLLGISDVMINFLQIIIGYIIIIKLTSWITEKAGIEHKDHGGDIANETQSRVSKMVNPVSV